LPGEIPGILNPSQTEARRNRKQDPIALALMVAQKPRRSGFCLLDCLDPDNFKYEIQAQEIASTQH